MTIEYPLEVAQQMARERDELRAENKWLKAELARWKPAHCGKIHPVPIPGEAVEYCVRDPDHDGPHQAQTGKVWIFPHDAWPT